MKKIYIKRHRKAPEPLDVVQSKAIEDALSTYGGHRRKAAQRLGISLRTLYNYLAKKRRMQYVQ